jgi:uncharacterized membrane protein YecN with MAPEG domain
MITNPPFVTAIFAAILGLLAALLTLNVIVNRVRLRVESGDGGLPAMGQAIRAHANFAEHVPLALLLIAAVEMLGTARWLVILLGVVLLVARLLSALGLARSLTGTPPRQAGAALNLIVTIAASVLILYGALAMH